MRILLALVGVAAFVFAGFLYVKTRSVGTEAQSELAAELREVRQLGAELAQQALASRFGLLNQYDALTATSERLREAERTVFEHLQSLSVIHARETDVATAVAAIEATERERQLAVEHFKSANSVLRNSLYYLPTAGSELALRLEADGQAELARDVQVLMQSALVHNLLRSESARSALLSSVEALRARGGAVKEGQQQAFTLFLRHAETTLRQQDVVDPLLAKISSGEVDVAVDTLERASNVAFERAAETVNRYRIALYVWSLVLLVAVVGAGVKLRQIYANLEHMVADRTQKLEAALRELWGEMALAKKIQTSLVPSQPRLEGCQVAAIMQPADEVGGDYYDVVRTPHNEWVLIGDVSGHGVTSGLVMMMCQVAVRTALEADPTMSPARLLALVNRTLTDNIRLLGEQKYLTITALCRTGKSFTYSGLHQDLLIYRADSQRLERLETRGLWLGLEASIEQHLQVDSFELATGDVLLLYTDGLTEAVLGGKMLDLEGLTSLLGRLATRDAPGIVSGIMEELAAYQRSDDVSAVVVKQA